MLFININGKDNINNVILFCLYNFVYKINYFFRIKFLDIELMD